jgi:hypothetical protein
MNKRFILILFALFSLIAAGTIPYREVIVPIVKAQLPGAGAQRAPSINITRTNDLFLTMSTATKPASAGTPGSQTFFMQSIDGGRTWDNFPVTRNLSNSPGEAFGPSMAINKTGKIRTYIVYHDNRSGTTQVYFLRSKKGTKFRKPRNITPNEGGAFAPRIALDSAENINIVWGDTLLPNRRVVFTRSNDLGDTFSDLIEVSRSSGNAFDPEIAVDSSEGVNVVWEDDGSGASAIMFARSADGGKTFSAPKLISSGSGEATEAHIATSPNGQIYVVWNQVINNGSRQAFLSRSTDNGASFSEPLNLSNDSGADIHKAFVTSRGNAVFVAYNNDQSASRQVYLVKSEDNGQTFGDPVQVSNANRSRGRGHSVSMCVDSEGTLHLVWIDSSVIGNDEGLLYYSRSSNGRTFTSQQQLLSIVIG